MLCTLSHSTMLDGVLVASGGLGSRHGPTQDSKSMVRLYLLQWSRRRPTRPARAGCLTERVGACSFSIHLHTAHRLWLTRQGRCHNHVTR